MLRTNHFSIIFITRKNKFLDPLKKNFGSNVKNGIRFLISLKRFLISPLGTIDFCETLLKRMDLLVHRSSKTDKHKLNLPVLIIGFMATLR